MKLPVKRSGRWGSDERDSGWIFVGAGFLDYRFGVDASGGSMTLSDRIKQAAEIWTAHRTIAILKSEIKSSTPSVDAFSAGASFGFQEAVRMLRNPIDNTWDQYHLDQLADWLEQQGEKK